MTLGAALAQPCSLLILDEPTSSLSGAEAAVLFKHLQQLRQAGTAILYVSHRLEEIFALADEVTVLRDGRRVWHGPLEETSPAALIHAMVGRELLAETRAPRVDPGPVVFRCHDFSAHDGSFTGIDVEVRGGEVLGVYGLIGAGRSEWRRQCLAFAPWQPGVSGFTARG